MYQHYYIFIKFYWYLNKYKDGTLFAFYFSLGIQTSEDAKFYALSASFDKFSNDGKDLVVQFSVKHEQNIDCGGGYVKVFPSSLDQTDMHGESPYNIMFGMY